MQRIPYTFLTTLLVSTMLAAPGTALHCNGEITTIHTGLETIHLDDRSDQTGELDHWIYLETNDREGLQSGGESIHKIKCGEGIIPCYTDPCHHSDPDLLII